MNAEIIAVGTEILTGQIVNTNAQYLSEKFAELGIDVYFQTAVGDNQERLLSVIKLASKRSQLVVLCGGLGPTEDDLTKQTLAKHLGKKLVFDPQAKERLDTFFATRPAHARTPNNERQAQLIEGSIALQNTTGLAVGGIIEEAGVTYVILPGPPSELMPMVRSELMPLLTGNNKLYSRVLRFFGIGESQLTTILASIINQQNDPTLAPYAKTGEVTLRISTKAPSQMVADAKIDAMESQILQASTLDGIKLKKLMYGYGEENSLAKVTVKLLMKKNKTIAAAESLTAGRFQSRIADFTGASKIFNGGFVTYNIFEKSNMLGIDYSELEKQGTVSAYAAEAMALGAREKTGTDIAVSLTGVAGPDELEGKPIGTVFIGIATDAGVNVYEIHIGARSRTDIQDISVLHAFNYVRQTLLNNEPLLSSD